VRRATVELVVQSQEPILVVHARVGEAFPWFQVPYSWSLSQERESTRYLVNAPWEPGRLARLTIRLADLDEGQLVARRRLLLDPAFSAYAHDLIRGQAFRPFDGYAHIRAISMLSLDRTRGGVPAPDGGMRTIALEAE
jgi:hypothetical protein